MTARSLIVCTILLATAIRVAPAGEANPEAAGAPDWKVADFESRTIYHSPQTPGYTCWVYLWKMQDQSAMAGFYQATGPAEGRPRAPMDVQKKLSWPHLSDPRRDMTGLKTCNVYLRSTDAGATWQTVSEDTFRSPMNGIVVGTAGLQNGTILRAVSGPCLTDDPDLPRTGLAQRSTDVTKTWDKPASLLPPEEFTVLPVGIRQLRDGRVVVVGGVARVPCGGAWGEYGLVMEPLLLVSNDNGQTWGPPVPVIPEENRKGWACEECDVAELPNGDLFWVFRRCAPEDQDRPLHQRRHVQWQGVMAKQGDTWTPKWVGPTPFPNTGLPNLVATREGVVLHVNVGHWTADAGKTWRRLDLPGTGYYPKGVQLDDGRILIVAHTGSDDPYGVDQKIVMSRFRLARP
ncbi:MAG: sialidase family protein [Planctomycetia bacterium]|nr:sialidase family protein [Planctomycetia bacterium]